MPAQPVEGNTGWGATQNAFTGESLDPSTGKVRNEALQVADTAPIADAALANKRYVDSKDELIAHGRFDSSGSSVGSYRVGGVNNVGTGEYEVSFSVNPSNANYTVVATAAGDNFTATTPTSGISISKFTIKTWLPGGGAGDSACSFTVFGDK